VCYPTGTLQNLKMKIGVNVRFLLRDRLEGLGRFTYEVVRRMVAAHPEHEFIFFFDRAYAEEFVFAPNVTPVILQPPARHVFLFFAWFEVAIPWALRKYGCDAYFSPDGFGTLFSPCPVVIVSHDLAYIHRPTDVSPLVRWYYNTMQPKHLAKASHIFTVSEDGKKTLLQAFPNIAETQVSVAYNSVTENYFTKINKIEQQNIRHKFSDGKPYFFYIGSVHPRKNVLGLLQAFEIFKTKNPENNDAMLLIGGRMAWQTSDINTFYQTMQHRESVRFLGFIDHQTLPLLVGSAYALCYVSLYEGFGIPILEGMHAEVPVLTSNTTSMPEVAADAALLVNPHDTTDIARGLTELWHNKSLCADLVQRGKIRRNAFDWQRSADSIFTVLNTILKQ
jgi:glycosyltransferase involved in cell wall biosynthesis